MISFRRQLEAMGTALLLIQRLPEDTVWALTCTNDDDVSSPSVLNIFASEGEWAALKTRLSLGKPTDTSSFNDHEQFMSFRHGTLLVSLIEQQEK